MTLWPEKTFAAAYEMTSLTTPFCFSNIFSLTHFSPYPFS
jgi:hypothetical protein